MALIICKKCGKQYSIIKDNCPWCGHPQQEPPANTAEQTPLKKKKELCILPPDERKNPILAAVFSFLFWWIALDTFYLKGLLIGFLKLLLMYSVFPTISIFAFYALYYFLPPKVSQEDFFNMARIFNPLTLLIIYFAFLELISILKAIYYIALPLDKFNRKYNSYIVKEQ